MTRRSTVAFVVLTLFGVLVAGAASAAKNDWEPLGTRNVTDKLDHDTIVVTAAEGTFTKLQVRVREAPVQFRSMKVHFANGETQDVALKDVIRPGKASRVIDLPGAARVIKSVDFVYDAQTLGKKGAVVRLFGRH